MAVPLRKFPTTTITIGILAVGIALGLSRFSGTVNDMEFRRGALLLASRAALEFQDEDYPDVGISISSVRSGGRVYSVQRSIVELSPGVREMRIFVGQGEDGIEFIRRFYSEETEMNGGRI